MSPQLRILMLLSDAFGGFGGISKFNRDFLAALDRSSLVARVDVLPRVISERIDEAIPRSVVYDRRAATGKAWFVWRWLRYQWREPPPDLVICGHIHLLPVAQLAARMARAHLALIIHGIEAWAKPRSVSRLHTKALDSVIAVSRTTAHRFRAWSKVPEDRFFILPNSVDLEHFTAQPKDPSLLQRYGCEGCRVILTVGRLASRERCKGFDEVIEAMPDLLAAFPDLKYLIVGDGPDRKRLTAKASGMGLSGAVAFAGRIPEAEKVAHYNLADAYVMPSSGEGFGIALIEAAACGIPVIGSEADGSREALLEGRLGRLVDPRHPEQLVEAVIEALNRRAVPRQGDLLDTFSPANFRRRVNEWVMGMAPGTSSRTTIQQAGVSAKQPVLGRQSAAS